jgi:L-ascorbate metabolism protein UlaG (beta-lactamase superfamily)
VAYLGIGQLGVLPEHYLHQYWENTVRAVGARAVIGIHWDDFFRPLSQPLRALPFAVDDLDRSMRVLQQLADADGVALHLPIVWRREDPWA